MKLLYIILVGFFMSLAADNPQFLYKVVSVQEWEKSQPLGYVVPGEMDKEFIHLATDAQLERITTKYWASIPFYLVLKLDPSRIKGRLALEKNPGGENLYYHLYEGTIPLNAVVEAKLINK